MGITEAVHQTVLARRKATPSRGELYIIADSAQVLEYLQRYPHEVPVYKLAMAPVYDYLVKLSEELDKMGWVLTIAWVPGHRHQIRCHIKSDRKARKTRREGFETIEKLLDWPDTIPTPSAMSDATYFAPMTHNSIWPPCVPGTWRLSTFYHRFCTCGYFQAIRDVQHPVLGLHQCG